MTCITTKKAFREAVAESGYYWIKRPGRIPEPAYYDARLQRWGFCSGDHAKADDYIPPMEIDRPCVYLETCRNCGGELTLTCEDCR